MDEAERAMLTAVFAEEAEQHLRSLEELLIKLEGKPHDQALVDEIFRSAHTIKGNASVLGADALTDFAHLLEEVLERVRSRTLFVSSAFVDLLLAAVDVLRGLCSEALTGVKGAAGDVAGVSRRLRALSDTSEAAPAEPDAQPSLRPSFDLPLTERRSIRVDLDKLDRLLTLTGELVVARGRLAEALEDPAGSRVHALEVLREADRLYADLQELSMRSRMVPLGPSLRQHVRPVRTLSRAAGKRIRLEIEGEDVEVDTTMVEQLRDPLTHMVRNAIDHGIEAPGLRRAAGKDPVGTLTLRARHDAGSVVVSVSDDGAGFSRQRIAERARQTGIAEPERLSDDDLLDLVFAPGFSTAAEVSALSGRGVAMDVVRRNIEALQGTVSIRSIEGRGSTVSLRVPLTLAIIQGFMVGVASETYVIPQDSVIECLELPRSAERGQQGVLNVRGEAVPYLRLRELFGLGGQPDARENVVVVQQDRTRAGIVVDRLLGATQTVIKPTGKLFANISVVSGSTILGNGRVALILSVRGLLRGVLRREAVEDSGRSLSQEVGSA